VAIAAHILIKHCPQKTRKARKISWRNPFSRCFRIAANVERQTQVHSRRFQDNSAALPRYSEKRFYLDTDGGVTNFVTAFFAPNFPIHVFVLFAFFVDI